MLQYLSMIFVMSVCYLVMSVYNFSELPAGCIITTWSISSLFVTVVSVMDGLGGVCQVPVAQRTIHWTFLRLTFFLYYHISFFYRAFVGLMPKMFLINIFYVWPDTLQWLPYLSWTWHIYPNYMVLYHWNYYTIRSFIANCLVIKYRGWSIAGIY